MDSVKYAIVGCGSVSGNRYFKNVDVVAAFGGQLVAVCDIHEEQALPRAEEFGVPYYLDLDEMLAKMDFDLMVNLTNHQSHFPLNLKALRAGKHVYTQKPMAVTTEEATILIEEAAERNLKLVSEEAVGLSPVTRTIRRLIDAGTIGKVVWVRSRSTHMASAARDYWPTDPTWKSKHGGGPLRDVGVERLHLLTALLGPAQRVTAMSGISHPEVIVRGGPYKGMRIEVEADDVTLVTLDFGDSVFAMMDAAWIGIEHMKGTRTPHLEVYGREGTICLTLGGVLELYRNEPELGVRGWTEVSMIPPVRPDAPRAVAGLVHAVECVLEDKPPIASGEHARHCIEIMEKAFVAARTGVTQDVETRF